jgi:hypothetical protein
VAGPGGSWARCRRRWRASSWSHEGWRRFLDRDRYALGVDHKMALRALFASVRGGLARFFATWGRYRCGVLGPGLSGCDRPGAAFRAALGASEAIRGRPSVGFRRDARCAAEKCCQLTTNLVDGDRRPFPAKGGLCTEAAPAVRIRSVGVRSPL